MLINYRNKRRGDNNLCYGNLHLSGHSDKPMDIFGDHWANHQNKIKDWLKRVKMMLLYRGYFLGYDSRKSHD